jgi:transcriptional regulator of nitric oxide reductase
MISWSSGSGRKYLPLLLALMALAFASPALAEKGKLRERLTPEVMAVVYPAGAERLGPEEGSPPAIAVYKGDKAVAYIFSTLDIIAAPAYAPIPYDVIAGVEPDGRITGAKVVFHREPYVWQDPVRQPQLDTFLAREAGMPLAGGVPMLRPDFVAGATITARLMRAGVHDTARLVLATRKSGRHGAHSRCRPLHAEVVGRADGHGGAPSHHLGRGCGGARQSGHDRCSARSAAR